MAIQNFRSKPLKKFFNTGKPKGLPVQNHERLSEMLTALNTATKAGDMALPGYAFHPLPPGSRFATTVTANWRLTFGWEDGNPIDVDLEDYH